MILNHAEALLQLLNDRIMYIAQFRAEVREHSFAEPHHKNVQLPGFLLIPARKAEAKYRKQYEEENP